MQLFLFFFLFIFIEGCLCHGGRRPTHPSPPLQGVFFERVPLPFPYFSSSFTSFSFPPFTSSPAYSFLYFLSFPLSFLSLSLIYIFASFIFVLSFPFLSCRIHFYLFIVMSLPFLFSLTALSLSSYFLFPFHSFPSILSSLWHVLSSRRILFTHVPSFPFMLFPLLDVTLHPRFFFFLTPLVPKNSAGSTSSLPRHELYGRPFGLQHSGLSLTKTNIDWSRLSKKRTTCLCCRNWSSRT